MVTQLDSCGSSIYAQSRLASREPSSGPQSCRTISGPNICCAVELGNKPVSRLARLQMTNLHSLPVSWVRRQSRRDKGSVCMQISHLRSQPLIPLEMRRPVWLPVAFLATATAEASCSPVLLKGTLCYALTGLFLSPCPPRFPGSWGPALV